MPSLSFSGSMLKLWEGIPENWWLFQDVVSFWNGSFFSWHVNFLGYRIYNIHWQANLTGFNTEYLHTFGHEFVANVGKYSILGYGLIYQWYTTTGCIHAWSMLSHLRVPGSPPWKWKTAIIPGDTRHGTMLSPNDVVSHEFVSTCSKVFQMRLWFWRVFVCLHFNSCI